MNMARGSPSHPFDEEIDTMDQKLWKSPQSSRDRKIESREDRSSSSRRGGAGSKLSRAMKFIRLPSKDSLPGKMKQEKETKYNSLNDSDDLSFQIPTVPENKEPVMHDRPVSPGKKLLTAKRSQSLLDQGTKDDGGFPEIPASLSLPYIQDSTFDTDWPEDEDRSTVKGRPSAVDPRIEKIQQMFQKEPHKIDTVMKMLEEYDRLDDVINQLQPKRSPPKPFAPIDILPDPRNSSVENTEEALFDPDPFKGVYVGSEPDPFNFGSNKDKDDGLDLMSLVQEEVNAADSAFCNIQEWCAFDKESFKLDKMEMPAMPDFNSVREKMVVPEMPDFNSMREKMVVPEMPDFESIKEKLFKSFSQNQSSNNTSNDTDETGPRQSPEVVRPVLVTIGTHDEDEAQRESMVVDKQTFLHVPVVSDDEDGIFEDSDSSANSEKDDVLTSLGPSRSHIDLLEDEEEEILSIRGLENIPLEEEYKLNEAGLGLI